MFADSVSDCLPEKPIPAGCAFMRVHVLNQPMQVFCILSRLICAKIMFSAGEILRQSDETIKNTLPYEMMEMNWDID